MPLKSTAVLLLLWTSLIAIPMPAQESFAIEPAGGPPPQIPAGLQSALQPSGTRLLRIVNGVRIPICELWWKKTISIHAAEELPNQMYGQIATGTLLGVLYLPDRGQDFKEHKFGPGLYTMRYADLHPSREKESEDKQYEPGVQSRSYYDFVLLSDLNSDRQFGVLRRADLFRLSRQVSGSEEPAMLALAPVNRLYKGFPSLVTDDQGNCAVQFRIEVRGKPRIQYLDMAILLATPPNLSVDD